MGASWGVPNSQSAEPGSEWPCGSQSDCGCRHHAVAWTEATSLLHSAGAVCELHGGNVVAQDTRLALDMILVEKDGVCVTLEGQCRQHSSRQNCFQGPGGPEHPLMK